MRSFPDVCFIAGADPGFLPTTSLVRANGTFFGGHHQTSALGRVGGGGTEVNRFEQFSCMAIRCYYRGSRVPLFKRGEAGMGVVFLYSEVQCIMGNGHIAHRIPSPLE